MSNNHKIIFNSIINNLETSINILKTEYDLKKRNLIKNNLETYRNKISMHLLMLKYNSELLGKFYKLYNMLYLNFHLNFILNKHPYSDKFIQNIIKGGDGE